ncbi:LysR family transcriptional regulator [Pseudoalteromonas sp. S4498]|uniref:LysR substrate-binding domain-containing protein n=1 Tax=Pseudoalteromonas TaxID=53246 RepID=UPI001107D1A9|nr:MULTISPECIES: LysR substrate-binding domain-containing protein [Pseudoalteromonas]MCG9760879.1 LysR substrate-binding domain-containing protein [Pseudoalteromonas sp. Isolate6]NKC21682.1 LysR family transcriptional regulator [Pseudoalteromonas galatheae]
MKYLSGSLLQILDASLRLNSFSKVAEELGLTPAAVSYQVRLLESRLGFLLFTRQSGGLEVTKEGRLICQQASKSLTQMHSAIAQAKQLNQDNKTLRITASTRFATQLLLPNLARFKSSNPDIDIEIDISDKIRPLVQSDFDIAIRFCDGVLEGAVEIKKLMNTSLVAVCSEAFWQQHQALLESPKTFPQFLLCSVKCRVGSLEWPSWSNWFENFTDIEWNTAEHISFDEMTQVIQFIQDENAIGLVEPKLATREVSSGRLVQLDKRELAIPAPYAYYAIIPDGRKDRAPIQKCLQWLQGLVNNSERKQ